MSTQLDMLQEDLREVLAHLAAFPADKFGLKRLALIEAAIEAATPPMMGHMRKRANLDAPAPLKSSCQTCSHPILCDRCVFASTKTILASAGKPKPAPGPYSWETPEQRDNRLAVRPLDAPSAGLDLGPYEGMHKKTRQALNAEANTPRFTFGADYEMDQRWLAAERAKLNGVKDEQRTVAPLTTTAEPDLYAFPTMAFNLTSLHNMNYGTSRY